MLYSFIKLLSLLTLFDVNTLFFSKITLTASSKSPLCLITSLSNLYCLEILLLLFSISSVIIRFFSFLSTVFFSFSTNVPNLQPYIFSNIFLLRSTKYSLKNSPFSFNNSISSSNDLV